MISKQKRLGQHFLKNQHKIKRILDALELKSGDLVIEIGPGHGELTKELGFRIKDLRKTRIIAIEKDEKLADDLGLRIKELGLANIEIINNDALKVLKSLILSPKSYKVVGNIPYYITGKLLRIIGDLKTKPEIIVLTIQKEVAERIAAKPPRMNLLAASVQFWASPEIIDYISKNDFKPAPKVESAIIKLTSITLDTRSRIKCYRKDYYKLAKILFKQPRKTILNNLEKGGLWAKNELRGKLAGLGIDPEARPQNLNVETIKKLSRMLYN